MHDRARRPGARSRPPEAGPRRADDDPGRRARRGAPASRSTVIDEREDHVDHDQDRHAPHPRRVERQVRAAGSRRRRTTPKRPKMAPRRRRPGRSAREHVARGRREEPGREEQRDQPPAAELLLDDVADDVERVAVHGEVDQPRVQEDRGDQPPVLAGAIPIDSPPGWTQPDRSLRAEPASRRSAPESGSRRRRRRPPRP